MFNFFFASYMIGALIVNLSLAQGPNQGPPGPTGPSGAQGVKGDKGSNGDKILYYSFVIIYYFKLM